MASTMNRCSLSFRRRAEEDLDKNEKKKRPAKPDTPARENEEIGGNCERPPKKLTGFHRDPVKGEVFGFIPQVAMEENCTT